MGYKREKHYECNKIGLIAEWILGTAKNSNYKTKIGVNIFHQIDMHVKITQIRYHD